MDIIYCEKLSAPWQKRGVRELLCAHEGEFIPPLSRRSGTTQTVFQPSDTPTAAPPNEYFEELCAQQFLLAVENDAVCGFFSFRKGYFPPVLKDFDDGKTLSLYISTIIVGGPYRRCGIARSFYGELSRLFPGESRLISTRTWSTNESHIGLLESLGFSGPVTIENDRGEGIDTVYYYSLKK